MNTKTWSERTLKRANVKMFRLKKFMRKKILFMYKTKTKPKPNPNSFYVCGLYMYRYLNYKIIKKVLNKDQVNK